MPEVIEEPKIVKIRKPHDCFGCGEIFPKGTEMECQVNKDDGELYRLYICLPCAKHWNEPFKDSFVDALGYGELKEFCQQAGKTCETCRESEIEKCCLTK